MIKDWGPSLDRYLSKGSVTGDLDSAMWFIDTIPISELHQAAPILDKHKDAVLKYVLTCVRTYGITDSLVRDLVRMLQRSRVKWTEVDVLLRGIHIEQQRMLQREINRTD